MRECVSWGLQQRQAGLFTAVATMSGKQHVYLLWVEDANDVEISVFLPVPALPRCTSLFVTAVSLLLPVALHCSCAHSCLSSAPITKDLLNRRLLCPPCTAAEITGASIRTVSLNIPPPLFTRAIAGRWTTCWTSNRMSSRYPVVAHAIQALFLDCLASTTARSCCVPCVVVEFGRLTPSSDSHLRVFWHICWLHVLLVCTVIAAPPHLSHSSLFLSVQSQK